MLTIGKKISLVLVTASIVVVVGYFFMLHPAEPQSSKIDSKVASSVTTAATFVSGAGNVNSPRVRPGASVGPFHAKLIGADADLARAYLEFAALGEQNAEARFFQAEIKKRCFSFSQLYGGTTLGAINKERSEVIAQKRRAAYEKLAQSCRGVPYDDGLYGPDLLRDAAKRGDQKAATSFQVWKSPTNPDEYLNAADSARAAARTGDPYVLENLAHHFDSLPDSLIWRIPGIDKVVAGKDIATAFELAACDSGADCAGTSFEASAVCARTGSCDLYDRTTRYQRNIATGEQFDQLQIIRNIINEGLRTGQWPDGFWTGSNGVPRPAGK